MEVKEKDTGLRGTLNGTLYVDKKVFYGRSDVRKVIRSLRDSNVIKRHIKKHSDKK